MIMRIFLRKVISKGMDKGFEMASGARKKPRNGQHQGISNEDRAEMQAMRDNQKRAKQAMRVGNRISKL